MLSGEVVDWKEYSFRLTVILVQAEIKEKDANPDSRYFLDLEEKMNADMGLSLDQIDDINKSYLDWAVKNKIDI